MAMTKVKSESESGQVDYLKYAGVEDDHDKTGDVEGAEGGVDDELWVVKPTEVYLIHDEICIIIIG